MNFLIIGDPLRNLKAITDTSLSIAREMLKRTYTVHWATPEDLFLWEGRVMARVENFTGCNEKSLPSTEFLKEHQAINSYDAVWIRKDPPFDTNYIALCWLLALEEKNVPIINPPSVLLRYHEKLIPWEALESGHLDVNEVIPTFLPMGRRFPVPENFPKGEAVTKPFFGHAGKDVERHESPKTPDPLSFLQPLQQEVTRTGDRRVIYLDGEVVGSFVRMPPAGEIKSNIASGGTGLLKDMNKKELGITERLGLFLKERGIIFAGADLMAEKISEVNITSPTGFETLSALGGPRLAARFVDYAESLL
jgi:glutathione synthase